MVGWNGWGRGKHTIDYKRRLARTGRSREKEINLKYSSKLGISY